jgi:LysM repeat protein
VNLASSLAALTSSCSATAYSFTSPTAYALNATVTTAPPTVTVTPPSTCTGSYTVQVTDDCNSVALALNVSTYSLLYANNLDIYCQNFAAAVNSTLYIPPQCKTYTWQALDSCNSVASSASVTVPQFLTWNPNFNSLCQNSLNYVGYQVCLR